MPTPPVPGPEEPRALSARERAILDGIEQDLDTDSPDLASAMSHLLTSTVSVPAGLVHGGLLVLALFLVLAVTGLIPAVVWALLAVLAAMVLVPWGMLRAFEWFDTDRTRDADPDHDAG